MANNFCVIDIGTNAVKCKLFNNGSYTTPFNKALTNSGKEDLDKDEVVSHITEFMQEAKEAGIDDKNVYICATEAFRTSANQEEIKAEVLAKTGRRVHIISARREAYLSAIGGLREIPADKLTAKNVLYIESGGGSTEISLVDLSGKQPRIVATTSLPFGSKRYGEKGDGAVYAKHIHGFIKHIEAKKFKVDESLACVINSSTASRIIARQYNAPAYSPKITMDKQEHMSIRNFCNKLYELLKNRKDITPEILEQYWIKDGDGFMGHAYILNRILSELKKQHFPAPLNNVPVTTTIGGLKDGLAREIEAAKDKSPEAMEKRLLTVFEDEQPPVSKEEKIKELKGRINDDKHWIDSYKKFYTDKNDGYKCESDENYLTVSDKNDNKIVYHSPNMAVIKQNKNSKDNKFYEDMIENSKRNGQCFVEFQDNVSLELKLKIYAACQKHGVTINNFTFEPQMLDEVSATTAQIVKAALQKNRPQKKTQSPTKIRDNSGHSDR